jgi:hypothetical protein
LGFHELTKDEQQTKCDGPGGVVMKEGGIRRFEVAGYSRERYTEVILTARIPKWLERPFVAVALLWRRLRYGYGFRRIPLTRGQFAIVDPEDYPRLVKQKWYAAKRPLTYYAQRRSGPSNRRRGTTTMHREVLKVPGHLLVDHINHNGLDNRKANLRAATYCENVWNCRKPKCGEMGSKYKGVSRQRGRKKWQAQITVRGRRTCLGYFKNEYDAAKAYDEAAKKFHGKFAYLNLEQVATDK